MMENTNQTNFEDLFVDTSDNVDEQVTDSNDFYDDNDFIDTTSNPIKFNEEVNDFVESPIQVNNFNFDSFEMNPEDEIEEAPISKLNFNTDIDLQDENSMFEEIIEQPEQIEEVVLEQPFIEENDINEDIDFGEEQKEVEINLENKDEEPVEEFK